jgi:hypothetical protein
MDDPKFVETELKVTASEDLEKQVQEELEKKRRRLQFPQY